jgi:hypothetical protein
LAQVLLNVKQFTKKDRINEYRLGEDLAKHWDPTRAARLSSASFQHQDMDNLILIGIGLLGLVGSRSVKLNAWKNNNKKK